MRARRLAVASTALAWATAGAPAWAFPVELYRGHDPGWGGFGCCAGVLAPAFLVFAATQWDKRWLRWGLLLAAVACAAAIVPAFRTSGEYIVVAISARELRVDHHLLRKSTPRVGSERIDASQVRCVVRRHDSCDGEGECEEYFRVELMRGRRELVPWDGNRHATADTARARCGDLAAYGVRMVEVPPSPAAK